MLLEEREIVLYLQSFLSCFCKMEITLNLWKKASEFLVRSYHQEAAPWSRETCVGFFSTEMKD